MSTKKKILIAVAVVIGLPLIAIAVVLATFDLDETINTQKDQYLPELEKALGRSVSVGAITTTILPTLGAEVRDVRIAGQTEGDAPLLVIDRVVFGADLWTAIKSAGDEVRLEQLVIDGLAANVVREADGSLSFDDIVQRMDKGPPPDEAPQPLSPEARRFIRNLELERIALENSRVTLVDKATGGAPATSTIDQILVELDDVQLSKAFEVHVAAAVFAEAPNFDVRVKLGPVPVGNPDAKLPVEFVTVKADAIELGGLIPYLGGAPLQLQSAAFSAELRLDDPVGLSGRSRSSGSLTLARIALGSGAPEGRAGAAKGQSEPFDVVVKPNVEFSLADGFLDLTGFEVRLAEMAVTANGRIAGFLEGRPTFEKLTIETDKLDFGRLFALVPTARASLPPGMVLGGPLTVKASADGDLTQQRISIDADLSGATVRVPDALDKPRGTPLKLAVDSQIAGKDLDLKGAALIVGPMAFKLAGTVKNFDNPTFDLRGGITPTPIDGFVRLLPSVKAAIPPDVQVAGRFAVELRASGSRANLDAKVGVKVDKADLKVPGATLAGSGSLDVTAKGSPAGAIGVTVGSDLNGLAIEAGEAFRKPAGTPLMFGANVAQAKGGALTVSDLRATVGPLKFVGNGTRSAAGDLDFKIKLERFAVGELARMLPALADSHYATARIGLTGKLKGNPARMETIEAEMADFFFGLGPSSLSGRLSVKNPDAPVINFDFSSPFCDLNALLPPPDPEAIPQPDGPPPEVPPIVQRMTADGRLQVKVGRMATLDFRNFDARLTLRNGLLTFTALDFDAYEGHFTAAPTTFNLAEPSPAFKIKMALKEVSADALLTAQAGLPRTLSGKMSTQVELAGNGLSWEVIRDSLDGSLGMALANGRFEKLELGNAVLKGVAEQVPLLKLERGVKTRLKDLAGQFEVANGRMTLIKPMTTDTAEGPLELTGSIGLDKTLDLKGTLKVRPETISALSRGKLKLDRALPVGLRIGGTVTDPTVSGVETQALLGVLLGAAAKAAGLEELDAARRKAEEEARAAAAAAQRKARDAANQARAAAERKKKELEQKAREEARKAKKAAEKKAKEEAKKRLRGLF